MALIGVLTDSDHAFNELTPYLEETQQTLLTITDETDIQKLDGVVLYLSNENRMVELIRWLLVLREFPTIFVWVVVPEIVTEEQDVFLELGANYVLAFPEDKKILSYTLINTLLCITPKKNKPEFLFHLDEMNQAVKINENQKVSLTRLEYKAINKLLEEQDQTVSYEALAEAIWPGRVFKDLGDVKFKVANVIFHLREKITNGPFSIRTTRGKGYVLGNS